MSNEIKSIEPICHMETYEGGGTTETLNFNEETYNKIKNDNEELRVNQIFKTSWFERNKYIRYIAQRHQNPIDIVSAKGKVKIGLITEQRIKKELQKVSDKEAKRYKNVYFGAVEFTIKSYYQKGIDTPLELYLLDDRILGNIQNSIITVLKGNLAYQKIKFIIQPDFSISMEDQNKELALTLYFNLQGIDMPPGSKVMSIETKMISLTGKHHIRKNYERDIIIPTLYSDLLETLNHRGNNNKITVPAEIKFHEISRRKVSEYSDVIINHNLTVFVIK